jgi:hypothetical protein
MLQIHELSKNYRVSAIVANGTFATAIHSVTRFATFRYFPLFLHQIGHLVNVNECHPRDSFSHL